MIWNITDSGCDTVRKMGNDLEKSGKFIRFFSVIRAKNSGWQCYPATQVFAPLSLLSVRDKERKSPQYWGMIKENNVCC